MDIDHSNTKPQGMTKGPMTSNAPDAERAEEPIDILQNEEATATAQEGDPKPKVTTKSLQIGQNLQHFRFI